MFPETPQNQALQIHLPDGELWFYAPFFNQAVSNQYLNDLLHTIPWQLDTIQLYGKKHPLPRLNAWFGDPGTEYTYSGITLQPEPWTSELLAIKYTIEQFTNCSFNSVLINRYRSGTDYIGWHSDNEKSLGLNPVIASLSFGASRKFKLRHQNNHLLQHELLLTHGSLLIMKGATQHNWKHCLPKARKINEERLNLTFRFIQNPEKKHILKLS